MHELDRLATFSAGECVFEPKFENEIIATRGSRSKSRTASADRIGDLGEVLGRRVDVDGRVGEEEDVCSLSIEDVEPRHPSDARRRRRTIWSAGRIVSG